MDLQKMFDAMSDMSRITRADYHLTLGALTEILEKVPPETPVKFDDGRQVGEEDSYRGYYADLAFEIGDKPSTASDVLQACRRAATDTYHGYKGGDYTYDERTPLWRAPYGCCGPAIIGADVRDGEVVLVTKDIGG
jgi:hypothetical protein